MSDGKWINTADVVPHHDSNDGQIVIENPVIDSETKQDKPVSSHDRGHETGLKRRNDVQIHDILQFVHDHSKISKPRGLHKLFIRSLQNSMLQRNNLGGIAQFFDENN